MPDFCGKRMLLPHACLYQASGLGCLRCEAHDVEFGKLMRLCPPNPCAQGKDSYGWFLLHVSCVCTGLGGGVYRLKGSKEAAMQMQHKSGTAEWDARSQAVGCGPDTQCRSHQLLLHTCLFCVWQAVLTPGSTGHKMWQWDVRNVEASGESLCAVHYAVQPLYLGGAWCMTHHCAPGSIPKCTDGRQNPSAPEDSSIDIRSEQIP